MQFENDPFNSETTGTGNRLSDEIAEEVANPDSQQILHTAAEKRGKPSTNCRRTTRNSNAR